LCRCRGVHYGRSLPPHSMMYGLSSIGLLFLWAVHGLASLAGIVGLILLIGWALKHVPAHRLKHWALWLIGIGLALSILTTPAMSGWGMMRGGRLGKGDGTFRQWMMNFDADDDVPASSSSSSVRR
ncbi:MAG: hypothetical protein PHS73_05370, partial [Candidatus Peribacteraceae bacterium]|nr:hypothetical protein [Candidatus Peribacteraceae bacterium]